MERTIEQFIRDGRLKTSEKRLATLWELHAPAIIIEHEKKIQEWCRTGELKKIVGGKDRDIVCTRVILDYEKKTGLGGYPFFEFQTVEGMVRFFTHGNWGPYLKAY